jgi:hypothetical protein
MARKQKNAGVFFGFPFGRFDPWYLVYCSFGRLVMSKTLKKSPADPYQFSKKTVVKPHASLNN